MKPTYELFDHTADVGVRARAATLDELLVQAVEGLYAVIGDLATTGESTRRAFAYDGDDAATLLRDLLADLLMAFETQQLRAVRFEARNFSDTRLEVAADMKSVDEEESDLRREVKAITYHELEVRPVEGGYEAVYIVDI